LEDRAVPSAGSTDIFHPMVIAGSSRGSPADTPDARIDPNSPSSPFAGVGSLEIAAKNTSFLGTATVIGKRYVLTAAHVIDLNNDGKVDRKDGLQGVYLVLNSDGDQSARIAVTGFNVAPDFTGFGRPSVNDDVAVLTLAEDVPDGVPIYSLPHSELKTGTVLTMIGYGRSGDGVRGYTTSADPFVKRVGENTVDAFYTQDDKGRPQGNESFRFDFDGPAGNGPLGGPTLGNGLETQLGGGDSGGPAFATEDGNLVLVGVTSFTQGANAPRFGSMGGGANLFPYVPFVTSVLDGSSSSSSTSSPPPPPTSGGGGIGVGAKPLRNPVKNFPPPPPPPPAPPPQDPPASQPPEDPPVAKPDPVGDLAPPVESAPPTVDPVPDPIPVLPTGPIIDWLPTDLTDPTHDGGIQLLPVYITLK
jgi:hypothetical protein